MTTRERLYLFDTTLRDGAQTQGVDFSVADKHRISEVLDDLGIDYIEGGYPGANDTDTAFFSEKPKLSQATFTAFGMTKRAGRSIANDPGFLQVLQLHERWDYGIRYQRACRQALTAGRWRQALTAIYRT